MLAAWASDESQRMKTLRCLRWLMKMAVMLWNLTCAWVLNFGPSCRPGAHLEVVLAQDVVATLHEDTPAQVGP